MSDNDNNKKLSALEILKSDYQKKLSNEYQSYEVEEIGLTIYWKQENMAQRARYIGALADKDIAGYVDVLIHRALNKSGGRMFKPQDRDQLLRFVDPDHIMDIANAILGSNDDDEFEEAAKN